MVTVADSVARDKWQGITHDTSPARHSSPNRAMALGLTRDPSWPLPNFNMVISLKKSQVEAPRMAQEGFLVGFQLKQTAGQNEHSKANVLDTQHSTQERAVTRTRTEINDSVSKQKGRASQTPQTQHLAAPKVQAQCPPHS